VSYLGFDLGVSVLTTYDADGFLGLQIDGYGEENSGLQPYELHAPYGFLARPLDPELDGGGQPIAGKGCQVLFALEGGRAHAWALGDPRVLKKLPPLQKGGSIQFGATGAFSLIDGQTGSQTTYIPYGFDSNGENPTKSMSVAINVDNAGQEFISIVHGDGQAIVLGPDGVTIKNKAGDAFYSLGADGHTLSGDITLHGSVSLGGETAQEVVLYTALAAWALALETKLTAGNAGGPIPVAVPFASLVATMKSQKVKAA